MSDTSNVVLAPVGPWMLTEKQATSLLDGATYDGRQLPSLLSQLGMTLDEVAAEYADVDGRNLITVLLKRVKDEAHEKSIAAQTGERIRDGHLVFAARLAAEALRHEDLPMLHRAGLTLQAVLDRAVPQSVIDVQVSCGLLPEGTLAADRALLTQVVSYAKAMYVANDIELPEAPEDSDDPELPDADDIIPSS